jgi:hypothetical protein
MSSGLLDGFETYAYSTPLSLMPPPAPPKPAATNPEAPAAAAPDAPATPPPSATPPPKPKGKP